MGREAVTVPGMQRPTGYSYAVRKSGTPVFIAGQVAGDAEGKVVGEGDIAAQVEQVYANLRRVVEACGGTLDDIVKITVYTTDLAHRPAIGAARERHFSQPFPASTFVVVSSLAAPAYLVEIEAVAVIA
jgi:enamine deaminase RidA (YjgF/YER057c/UK114 family)